MNYNNSGGYDFSRRVEHLEKQLEGFSGQLTESIRAQGVMSAQLNAQARDITTLSQDVKSIVNKLDGVGRMDGKTLISILSTGVGAVALSITIIAYVGSLAIDPIVKRIDWQEQHFNERTKERIYKSDYDKDSKEINEKFNRLEQRLLREIDLRTPPQK